MIQITHSDEAIASERFLPDISDTHADGYRRLLTSLSNSLPTSRERLLQAEIQRVQQPFHEEQAPEMDIDTLKYLAVLNVLMDLSKQGWVFEINGEELTLRMENDSVDDKEHIRCRLSAERNAQFKAKSVRQFIQAMETPKQYQGEQLSIRDLIGNTEHLLNRIRDGRKVCEPYIQMVSAERDAETGYRLSDIWRYFRYTWSIPYKTMPGRNIFYLVRDHAQPHHPVMGIFALGNSVLNLTVRDDDIGWTVDAIRQQLKRREAVCHCEQIVKDTYGKAVKVRINTPIESDEEYRLRVNAYADATYPLLMKHIDQAIRDIYVRDLDYDRRTRRPRPEQIEALLRIAEESGRLAINNHNNEVNPNWQDEAQTPLFRRKRASELAKLLSAKRTFQAAAGDTCFDKLNALISNESGRKAITTALIANRKCKIGSNMMEIIVCGAIPPYNELLGGKLVSILACSPTVIRDYTLRYENQISEIASRMKGERVVRDSKLAFLGTTSLYATGSSQYNRIKVPEDGSRLRFREMGITEGYGTVYFSTETTSLFSIILERLDGGKRIGHVFGEGTSPRFRMISRGLNAIGIRADAFLKHYSPRIVYSMELARNTKEFLLGHTDELDYGFDPDDKDQVTSRTNEYIDYWYHRWLEKRLTTVDIEDRLERFNIDELLLSSQL